MSSEGRAVFETWLATPGMSPAEALKAMRAEAQTVLSWTSSHTTVILQGTPNGIQPTTNLPDVHVRFVAAAEDGWLDVFAASVRQALAREIALYGEVFARVLVRQGQNADAKLRTSVSGYVVEVTEERIRFLDGVVVALEDVREAAL